MSTPIPSAVRLSWPEPRCGPAGANLANIEPASTTIATMSSLGSAINVNWV